MQVDLAILKSVLIWFRVLHVHVVQFNKFGYVLMNQGIDWQLAVDSMMSGLQCLHMISVANAAISCTREHSRGTQKCLGMNRDKG